MKMKIYHSEMYPVYYLNEDGWGEDIEISPEVFAGYTKACEEWNKYQGILDDLEEKAKNKKILENCKSGIPARGFD
jgi:hypothetical protein